MKGHNHRRSMADHAERSVNEREPSPACGLEPMQIRTPVIHKPGFAEEARRQSLAVSKSPQEQGIADFIERVMDYTGWV
jgi:hypothetical protein